MNNKIASGEVLAITTGIIANMFFTLINIRILGISKNASLISFLIALVLGIIPILIIMFISKKIETDFFTFLKQKFKLLAYPIIIILTLLTIYFLMIDSWVMTDFIISQFLTRESYYFIAIIFSITTIICVSKGIEVTSRTIFILFIITIIIILLFFGTLINYVDLENFKPIIDTNKTNIIKSIIICILNTTAPLLFILNLKGYCKDKKNFAKKILIGYIFIMLIMFLFLFFIIGTYGINYAEILTYPVYALFKKVQILGFIERIENISSVMFITAYFSSFTYLIYTIKDNIANTFKITKKKIINVITISLSLLIPIISIYLFKTYEISYLINYTPYILGINFIILIILFIRCLFIRKT